jgi:hypothetical protein
LINGIRCKALICHDSKINGNTGQELAHERIQSDNINFHS